MTPEQFKALRLRMGYTQAGIASGLSISARNLQRYESGTLAIPEHICKLITYINVYGELHPLDYGHNPRQKDENQ